MTDRIAFSASFHLRLAALTLLVLVLGFGGWAAGARISGAVISMGHLDIKDRKQVVEHPEGGVIEAVLVNEGASVTAGEVLIRLDGAHLNSELALIEARYFELIARRARLEAERDGNPEIRLPDELRDGARRRDDLRAQIDGQARLLQARRDTTSGLITQLKQRRVQIMAQIDGITAQIEALQRQRALAEQERITQMELSQKGLARMAPVLALERELARLDGHAAALRADRAAAAERHEEIGQQILSLSAQLREEAERDLQEISAQLPELTERLRALHERIDRLELRAPTDGVVHDLQITTPRAVLRPAEPALFVIPQDQPWFITARIPPAAIDQVWIGQPAGVAFPGTGTRELPPLLADVVHISADAFLEQSTGNNYYRVELALTPDTIAALGERAILPGMPVDVFLQTGSHTPLQYLTRPLTSFFVRALREN